MLFRSSPFETLYEAELDERIKKLKELSQSLQEFTSNGLVLADLFYGNLILTEDKTVQIIDTDGNNVVLLKGNCQFQKMLASFQGIIFECCESEITMLKHSGENIPLIDFDHLSYDALDGLLDYINSEQAKKQYQKIFK